MRSSLRFFESACFQAAIFQEFKGHLIKPRLYLIKPRLLITTRGTPFYLGFGRDRESVASMSYSDEEGVESDVEETEEGKAIKEMVEACKYG